MRRVFEVKRKFWSAWILLLVMGFMAAAGGCGGGGGSDGGGSGDGGETTPVTREAIEDAQKILDDAKESVFVENSVKVDELDFDVYAERIMDYLNSHEDVEEALFYQGESALNSAIAVKFNSGFTQIMTFHDEASSSLLDSGANAIPSRTGAGHNPRGVSPAAIDPSKPVNTVAISYLNARDVTAIEASRHRSDLVNGYSQIAHSDYEGPYSEYNDSLRPLRSLNGYNLIIITAHGWSYQGFLNLDKPSGIPESYFSVPYNSSAALSAQDMEDYNNKRIGIHSLSEVRIDSSNPEQVRVTSEEAIGIAVYPEFFKHYYKSNKLSGPIVYLASCLLMEGWDHPIADAFREAGAKAVIGFDKSVKQEYDKRVGLEIIDSLLNGNTVNQAMASAKEEWGATDASEKFKEKLREAGESEEYIAYWTDGAKGAKLYADGDGSAALDITIPSPTPTPTPAPTPTPTPTPDTGVDTSWYSPDATEFTIKNAAELAGLAAIVNTGVNFSGKTIRLVSDINLAGREWTPIGIARNKALYPFYGTFDGGGGTIVDLTINGTVEYPGLFGINYGTLKNIRLADVNIDAYSSDYASAAGGLVGYNEGTIESCTASGSVSSSSSRTGGLVGENRGTIEDCTASSDVSSSSYAGGLVGWNNYGTIQNCTASGSVSSSSSAGGLVGSEVGGTITDCTASGKNIIAESGGCKGGFIGLVYGLGSSNITNNRNETGISPAIGQDGRLTPAGPSNNI
jgi:hypothetical protein